MTIAVTRTSAAGVARRRVGQWRNTIECLSLLCIRKDSCQSAVPLFVKGRQKLLYRGSTRTPHGASVARRRVRSRRSTKNVCRCCVSAKIRANPRYRCSSAAGKNLYRGSTRTPHGSSVARRRGRPRRSTCQCFSCCLSATIRANPRYSGSSAVAENGITADQREQPPVVGAASSRTLPPIGGEAHDGGDHHNWTVLPLAALLHRFAGGSCVHHHCGGSGLARGHTSSSVLPSYSRPFFIT